jgi:TP901 family phage tail tape measure protein
MGEAVDKLSGKLGVDTSDFKTGMAAANRELRVLESGFRANTAAMGDWSQSSAGLEARAKSLTSQIDIQKLKVAALREEHQRLVDENGANSRAAQDAEIKLNKETETLGKMENELGNTETQLQSMKGGEQEVGEKAEQTGNKLQTLKGVLHGLGDATKVAIAGVVALGAASIATIAMITGLVTASAKTADELVTLSDQTGISTTRLQEMKYAGDILGTSVDTITSSMAKMTRSMASAKDGTGAQADAFKALGVSVVDSNGNLRDQQSVFNDTIDALGKVQNPAERDALAMDILGKSAQELNPLIKAGSGELARLSEEAHKNGAVVSTETVSALSALQDQMDGLKNGLSGLGMSIAGAFAPFASDILTKATGYLQELVQIINNPDASVGGKANGIAALFVRMVTDLSTAAPDILKGALTMIQSLVKALTGALPQLLPAAISILKMLIQFIVQNLPVLIKAGVQILLMLVNAIIENLPMLIDAALQAIITLANGIADALPTLIPAVIQAILTIVQTLIKNLPMLIQAALALILGLANGLVAALPILLPYLPIIVKGIADALVQSLPMIARAAGELIAVLATGLIENLPTLIESALQLIYAIYDAIGPEAQAGAMWNIAKGLVDGLIQGFDDNWNNLVSNLTANFTALLNYLKGLLGIASPSKLFAEMGKFSVMGFEAGFMKEMAGMQRRLGGVMFNSMGTLGNAALAGSSASNSESYSFYAPVVFQGAPSSGMGQAMKRRRY